MLFVIARVHNKVQEQLEELQKELKEEKQTTSSFMKWKEAALREKEELQRKIDDLQQELEQHQVKDHKEVSVQCDYTLTQSGICVCVHCSTMYIYSLLGFDVFFIHIIYFLFIELQSEIQKIKNESETFQSMYTHYLLLINDLFL